MVDSLTHYCSTNTFISFLSSQELWLTSLSQSNDTLEGEWLAQHWINRVNRGSREERQKRCAMRLLLDMAKEGNIALGTCFSEERDLLSQWRGYANDGAGFGLVFDFEKLTGLFGSFAEQEAVELVQIAYGNHDWDRINDLVKPLIDTFLPEISHFDCDPVTGQGSGRFEFGPAGEKHIKWKNAAANLFKAKSGAFHEEREWRLLLFDTANDIQDLEFRSIPTGISPFRRQPIPLDALAGVMIGPKNTTPENLVTDALRTYGFSHTWVRRSAASYR